MFFPYDATLLRCHPMAALITSSVSNTLRCKSRMKVSYQCALCGNELVGRCCDLHRQTLLCSNHKTHGRVHFHYAGDIPMKLSRPIRAGILMGVNHDNLVELIASLLSVNESVNPQSLSEQYIAEITEYDRVYLADNCFWGDDSASRVKKDRYKRKCNVKLAAGVEEKSTRKRSRIGNPIDQQKPVGVYFNPLLLLHYNICHCVTGTAGPWPTDVEAVHIENMPSSITIDNPDTIAQSVVGEAEGQGHTDDHKWDDILRAIDEDLRAFWGLWNTVILPRLNPNIPTEREAMDEWNGDGVDMNDVWIQTEDLQAQVKELIDKRQTKPEEERSWGCLNGLVAPSQYPERNKTYFGLFMFRIRLVECSPGLIYPMPVN